jgi:hypothetical protein
MPVGCEEIFGYFPAIIQGDFVGVHAVLNQNPQARSAENPTWGLAGRAKEYWFSILANGALATFIFWSTTCEEISQLVRVYNPSYIVGC